MNTLFNPSDDLGFNDSNHSTMTVDRDDFKNFRAKPLAPSDSDDEHLAEPEQGMPRHQQGYPKSVRFSKVLQVREVRHRRDMTPTELNELWNMNPDISPSIFDVRPDEAFPSSEEHEARRRRRRDAYKVRMQVLSEVAECKRMGTDMSSVSHNYEQYSAQSVQNAHVLALRHAHSVDEDAHGGGTTPGPLVERKRLSVSHPLAAVKRLRLSS